MTFSRLIGYIAGSWLYAWTSGGEMMSEASYFSLMLTVVYLYEAFGVPWIYRLMSE